MAPDWTKPIRQKNGKALRFLCELQSTMAKYPVVCVATSDNGNEYLVTYTKDGLYNRDNKKESTYNVENIPDTKTAQPEIDWAGEVQMSCQERDMWEDFVPLFTNKDHVYGYTVRGGVERALVWHFTNFHFRNKPAEPKRVKAILKLWRSAAGDTLCIRSYIKDDATTVESVRVWHPKKEGKLLSVVEIDLHEGEGLEDGK